MVHSIPKMVMDTRIMPGTLTSGIIVLVMFFFSTNFSFAQGSADYGKGLKVNFDEVESKFIRLVFWNQFWAGSIENNPGTIVNGEPANTTFNYGARRMRILAHTQISPRYLIVMHFGVNNQTFASGKKPQLFFHDAYNEYAIIPVADPVTQEENRFNLYAGAGLHYWNGVSRLTSGSTLNMLMVDAPVFNWPTIDLSDQFARQFGVYAKGGYHRLRYQFHLNKPFVTSFTPEPGADIAVDNNGDPDPAIGGYLDYQLLEKESQSLPFRVGTYMGTKKVFNIGTGFYHNKDATKSSSSAEGARSHDIKLFGLDVFADLPVGNIDKNMAFTLYAVYYNFDFGPNYLRTSAICNPGVLDINGVSDYNHVLEGAGNARVMSGTGEILYSQAGLLLPRLRNSKIRIQPMGSVAYKNLEYLNQPGTFWDLGANIYLDGHHAKVTLQYSSRPVYDELSRQVSDRKSEIIVQMQVYL